MPIHFNASLYAILLNLCSLAGVIMDVMSQIFFFPMYNVQQCSMVTNHLLPLVKLRYWSPGATVVVTQIWMLLYSVFCMIACAKWNFCCLRMQVAEQSIGFTSCFLINFRGQMAVLKHWLYFLSKYNGWSQYMTEYHTVLESPIKSTLSSFICK